MNKYTEKLNNAKKLILDVEEELISDKRFCPYEIGFTLRKLDEAIEQLNKEE
jgi:hypothetical protein